MIVLKCNDQCELFPLSLTTSFYLIGYSSIKTACDWSFLSVVASTCLLDQIKTTYNDFFFDSL